MMGKTHMAIGAAVTTPFILSGSINPLFGGTLIALSILPDMDQKIIGLKHRGVTHTLLANAGVYFALSFFSKDVALVGGLVYLSHIIVDSFTVRGVPLLFPFSSKNLGFKFCKADGIMDRILRYASLIFIVYFLYLNLIK